MGIAHSICSTPSEMLRIIRMSIIMVSSIQHRKISSQVRRIVDQQNDSYIVHKPFIMSRLYRWQTLWIFYGYAMRLAWELICLIVGRIGLDVSIRNRRIWIIMWSSKLLPFDCWSLSLSAQQYVCQVCCQYSFCLHDIGKMIC